MNDKNKNKTTGIKAKVQDLAVKDFSQANISKILQVNKSAVSRDIPYLKQQVASKRNHFLAYPRQITL